MPDIAPLPFNEGLSFLDAVFERMSETVLITQAEPVTLPGPRIVYANPAFTRSTGYRLEELLGQTPRLLQGPRTDRAELDRVRDALLRWQPVRTELVNYTKDGEELWLDLDISPIADATGYYRYWVAVGRDVTARRREEQVLRESELQLRLALRGGDLGLWDWDAATGTMRVNERWLTMLGLPADAAAPSIDEWHARVHPADMLTLERLMREVIRNPAGVDFEAEIRARHEDGHWVWLLDRGAVMRRDASGRPLRIVGTHMDISARKAAEQALKQREQQLSALIESASDAIVSFDAGGAIVLFNQAASRMFALTPELAVGRPVAALLPDGGDLTTGVIHGVVARRADGSPFDAQLTLSAADAVGVRTAIVRDLTESQRAERALRDKALAEEANRAKDMFLARMSHELRTPLNAVLGFSQLLLHDPGVRASSDTMMRVEHIHAAGAHLLAMIDEVLDLSRISAGEVRLSIEPVLLGPLIDECLALVQAQAARRQVVLQVHGMSGRAVLADRVRLRQALVNLLTNAIKYNREGGRVDVEKADDGGMASVTVRDTGIGLTAQQLEHLFEPFNRLGAERLGVEGTGLGLVIARQLVEAMSGTLRATAQAGAGAAFTLRLPLVTAAVDRTPPAAGSHGPSPAAGPAIRVLYVEDNPMNVELMRQTMQRQRGVTLEIAVDGASALRAARAAVPDLMLIDIDLPDMTGIALLDALRAEPALRQVACVAVSANAMEADVQRALAAGFASYVTKPFRIIELVALIESYRVRVQGNGMQ